MIPGYLLQHTAIIEPWLPSGTFGDPIRLRCSAQLSGRAVQDTDGVRASGFLFTDPGDPIPVGSHVTVRDLVDATVVNSEAYADGGVTGLDYRKIEWETHPMLSMASVDRYVGDGPLDPESNLQDPVWIPVWAGRCRVQTLWVDRNETLGEQRVDYDRIRVAVPWSSPVFLPSMRITITASNDPHLQGLVAIIESADRDAVAEERRYLASVDQG